MTKIPGVPSRTEWKAIRRPSGENAGEPSAPSLSAVRFVAL
jgi:hypothetical protein